MTDKYLSKMNIRFNKHNYVYAILILFILSFLIFIINRGFQFSDEGYYLSGYNYAQPIGHTLTYFHIIVRKLFSDLATNVIFIRLIRILVSIVASFIIARGINKYYPNKPFVPFFTIAFIGIFVSYTIGPQSLSYNSINQFLLACAFYSLVKIIHDKSKVLTNSILLGIILSLILINKPTTAPPLLVIIVLAIIFNYKLSQSIRFVLYILGSFFIALILINKAWQLNVFSNFHEIFNFIATNKSSHDTGMVINTLKGFILQSRLPIIGAFAITLILALVNKFSIQWLLAIGGVLIISFCIYLLGFDIQITESRFIFFYALAWSILYAYLGFKKNNDLFFQRRNKKELSLLIILLGFPIIGAFGSDIGIFRNALFYSHFWLLIPICFILNKPHLHFYAITTTVIVLTLSITTIYLKPYRMTNIRNLSKSICHPDWPSTRIKISESQYKEFENLKNSLLCNNYKKGDFIFGMGENIGYIFFLEGIQPNGFSFSTKNLPLYMAFSQVGWANQYIVIKNYQLDNFIESIGIDKLDNHRLVSSGNQYIYCPN